MCTQRLVTFQAHPTLQTHISVHMCVMPKLNSESPGCTWMMQQPDWMTRFIPIFVHGDGTPITGIGKSWAKSSQIWNWGSLLGSGNTKQVVFWIWNVFKDIMTKTATRKRFWKILWWSQTALQRGLWPSTNWDGQAWVLGSLDAVRAGTPLVGEDPSTCFACQLWRLKGDLEDVHEDMWCVDMFT